MKNQRFRFRVVALLLAGLILLAGVSGMRMLPGSESTASLRDAIRRLTGQPLSPAPAPSVSPSPAQEQSLWGTPTPADTVSPSGQSLWGTPIPAETAPASGQSIWGTPTPAETAPDSGQSLWGTPIPAETTPASEQSLWGTPQPSQAVSPDSALSGVEHVSSGQALSSPFLTPDVSMAPTAAAPAPLSEALSYYFGSQEQEIPNPAAAPGEIP